MSFKQLRKNVRIILIIQCIGMLMGTSTHVAWVIQNGFLSEHYHAPLFSMIFWDSLTFLDPIAAILLIIRPKTGLYLTLVIITADVLHNNVFYYEELYATPRPIPDWISAYWMIPGQILFGLLCWLTLRFNLRTINARIR